MVASAGSSRAAPNGKNKKVIAGLMKAAKTVAKAVAKRKQKTGELSQVELEATILRGFARGKDPLDKNMEPDVMVVPVKPGSTGVKEFPAAWLRKESSKRVERGTAEWFVPKGADPKRRMLFLHGGSYTVYAPCDPPYRSLCSRLAATCQLCVLSVDYRMAPKHLFPAAYDDGMAALRWIVDHGPDSRTQLSPATDIFVCGDSAGGGLALATCVNAPRIVQPKLRGVIGLSAWLDMTASTPSYDTRQWNARRCFGDSVNAGCDRKGGREEAEVYLGRGGVKRSGQDWRASPFWTPDTLLKSMPPVLLHVGDYELILDESVQLHAKMEKAGHKDATVCVYPRMWHCFHEYAEGGGVGQPLDVASQAIRDIGTWVKKRL